MNVHHPPGLHIITLIIYSCQDLYRLFIFTVRHKYCLQDYQTESNSLNAGGFRCRHKLLLPVSVHLKTVKEPKVISVLYHPSAQSIVKKKKKCLTPSPAAMKAEGGLFVYPLPWWIISSELPHACLFISSQHFFFNLRSTLILIKPTLLGLKKRFLIQDRVWETASSVFPGSVCFSSSEGKRYLVLWIGEAWFRGSDRSIEWPMWGWLSKAVLRGPEVIRQTSKSGYFQYLDENPLLPGRHCTGADRMDSGLEEYWISSSSNCLESL